MVHFTQIVHLSCVEISIVSQRTNKLPFDPRLLAVPLGTPKTIYEPIACLALAVQLSCIEINTISKQTKMSFYLTHVTNKVLWVGQKRFQCLWYV
jgi:hypothetical protein